MALLKPVKPPAIRGKVPDGYTGRVSYRMEVFSYEGLKRTVFHGVVTFLDRKLIQELGAPSNTGLQALQKTALSWIRKERC